MRGLASQLTFSGCRNARDLGGLPTPHGPTRHGVVVRTDDLYHLDDPAIFQGWPTPPFIDAHASLLDWTGQSIGILSDLHRNRGGAEAYLLNVGVSGADIARLRTRLLSGEDK